MTWEGLLVTLDYKNLCLCSAEEWAKGSLHSRQVLYHWIILIYYGPGIEHKASDMLSKDFSISKPHVTDDNASLKGY